MIGAGPRWRRGLWFAGVGLVCGTLFAVAVFAFTGAAIVLVIGPVACGLAGWLAGVVVEGAADLGGRLFLGGNVGTRPEYSAARALAIRGRFEEAVAAYRSGAEEWPEDPEPLIQGASILRDHLGRLDEAEQWLLRASRLPRLEEGQTIIVLRELIGLHEVSGEPARALPPLARVAEEQGSTRAGEWAAGELARLRAAIWSAEAAPGRPQAGRGNGDD